MYRAFFMFTFSRSARRLGMGSLHAGRGAKPNRARSDDRGSHQVGTARRQPTGGPCIQSMIQTPQPGWLTQNPPDPLCVRPISLDLALPDLLPGLACAVRAATMPPSCAGRCGDGPNLVRLA